MYFLKTGPQSSLVCECCELYCDTKALLNVWAVSGQSKADHFQWYKQNIGRLNHFTTFQLLHTIHVFVLSILISFHGGEKCQIRSCFCSQQMEWPGKLHCPQSPVTTSTSWATLNTCLCMYLTYSYSSPNFIHLKATCQVLSCLSNHERKTGTS